MITKEQNKLEENWISFQTVFDKYSELLEYPNEQSKESIENSILILNSLSQGSLDENETAINEMRNFRDRFISSDKVSLEEAFTKTFDLKMVSYPYAGFHLFGESFKRGEFLSKLMARYQECGFDYGTYVFKDFDTGELNDAIKAEGLQIKELPDHIKIIIRFLASLDYRLAPDEISTILEDCLIPVLNDMLYDFGHREKRDPLKSSAFFEVGDGSACNTCLGAPEATPAVGKFSYQEKPKNKSSEERGLHKDNPYASLLKSLLASLESAQVFMKGVKEYA